MSRASEQLTYTTRHTLANGMTALLYRADTAPVVSVRGDLLTGALHDPAELHGLAVLTAAALIRGTRQHTFQQITDTIEERGCSISVSSSIHTTSFSGKSLPEDLPLVLELLGELLRFPTFPEQEIERLRGQVLMNLREYEQDTRFRAGRTLRRLMFPPAHPYSRPTLGNATSVAQISRSAMQEFHQQHYSPMNGTIVIVGDIDSEVVLRLIEQIFGDWTTPPPPDRPLPPVPPLSGIQRTHEAVAGKVQTDLLWAVHGLRRTDPDFYAAMIANMVLGQFGMGGRLWHEVRDRQGLAYAVSSNLEAGIGAGLWLAYAGVNPKHVEQALAAIVGEIQRFVAEGATPEEVSDVRAYLTGSLALGLETTGGIASTLLAIERYGLGLDYVARYPDLINAVTHDQILAAARRYLSLDHYVVVSAGPQL